MLHLYFIPNDPERTTLVSANGVAQYRVVTSKAGAIRSPAITLVSRPADTAANSMVGEIEWRRRWGAHPVVRSNVFDGVDQKIEIRELLYKVGSTFSTARFFLGNDNEEYRWKYSKGSGYVLTHRTTGEEIARYLQDVVREGLFCGERKWGLRIRPSTLDIDFIVLTFLILEKRRRDKARKDEHESSRQEATCEGGTEMACA